MAASSLYPYEWMGRVRASLPKVKTGCVTCKKRRVKCDEWKPICNRCQKGSRACVYQIQQTAVSKDETLQISLQYSAPRSPVAKIQFSSVSIPDGINAFLSHFLRAMSWVAAGSMTRAVSWLARARMLLQLNVQASSPLCPIDVRVSC